MQWNFTFILISETKFSPQSSRTKKIKISFDYNDAILLYSIFVDIIYYIYYIYILYYIYIKLNYKLKSK